MLFDWDFTRYQVPFKNQFCTIFGQVIKKFLIILKVKVYITYEITQKLNYYLISKYWFEKLM